MLSMTLIKTKHKVTKMAPFKAPIPAYFTQRICDSASIPYRDIRNFIACHWWLWTLPGKIPCFIFPGHIPQAGSLENEKTKGHTGIYVFLRKVFGNQLSALWQRIIRERKQTNESIRFFDVIVKERKQSP